MCEADAAAVDQAEVWFADEAEADGGDAGVVDEGCVGSFADEGAGYVGDGFAAVSEVIFE